MKWITLIVVIMMSCTHGTRNLTPPKVACVDGENQAEETALVDAMVRRYLCDQTANLQGVEEVCLSVRKADASESLLQRLATFQTGPQYSFKSTSDCLQDADPTQGRLRRSNHNRSVFVGISSIIDDGEGGSTVRIHYSRGPRAGAVDVYRAICRDGYWHASLIRHAGVAARVPPSTSGGLGCCT